MPARPERIAKCPTPAVESWMRLVHNACRAERMRPALEKVIRLAALLAVAAEEPSSQDGQRAFWAFKCLFINGARLPRWDAALQKIPPDRTAVLRVAECCRIFGHFAGPRDLAKGHFALDQVIGVMLELEDPQGYIEHAARSGFLKPGALFHPNTLESARKRLRGSLGTLARDRAGHDSDIEQRLRVVKA